MRIGIDVGGTNTDAVLMESMSILAEVKTATTSDVSTGIINAIKVILAEAKVDPKEITAVMIGTTHFTNAVVERKHLQSVAIIRLGLPATAALPPMVGWPEELSGKIETKSFLAHGGYEFDGRLISPLDPDEIRGIAEEIKKSGIESVAISSVFSPINSEIETDAAKIVQEVLPDASITVSSEIGQMGLLERENAAIMNACLRKLAIHTVTAFRQSIKEMNIDAPLYISQNDGTLMSADFVERYPVLTFASGPTNSMRGAAFLSGLKDAVVVDIGGTTTDLGVLINGFPRGTTVATEIGDVRTNFRMPDVYSFGLGGGSLVSVDPQTIGPESVGYKLTSESRVFGGETLTTTDMAVAAGMIELGDKSAVSNLDPKQIASVIQEIQQMVADGVDRMKTSANPVPVILVGGGSILVHDELEGASEVVKPDHFAVANAVGAAITQIGGEVDRIFSLASISREDAMEQAKEEAIGKAVAAGADPETTEIVDIEEIPLAYLPGNATRIRMKAVGDLVL